MSYVVGNGTFKHFLVERIPEGYQFLGTNQVVHDQLFDLVSYHEVSNFLLSNRAWVSIHRVRVTSRVDVFVAKIYLKI